MLLENKSPHTIGLIGHAIINYPTPDLTLKIIDVMVKNKAALIELEIPFSEAVADDPLFVAANHEAIMNGVTLSDCFDFMAKVTREYTIPFVFMTYANLVYQHGLKNFVLDAKKAGASGAIIPDLPLDLAEDYIAFCKEKGFTALPILSLNMSEMRLAELSPYFEGFITVVSGNILSEDNNRIPTFIEKLKCYTQLPIAMGSGVTKAQDLDYLDGKVDYAVINTATLHIFKDKGVGGVSALWQQLSTLLTQ